MDRLRSFRWLKRPIPQEEEGQGLAEYAMVLTLIGIAVMVALTTLQGAISTALSNTAAAL